MILPDTSVKIPGVRNVPILDMRNGGEHEAYQFETPSEYVCGLAWNAYCERSTSGGSEPMEPRLARLVRDCKRNGETVLFASLHNFAVSVYVAVR